MIKRIGVFLLYTTLFVAALYAILWDSQQRAERNARAVLVEESEVTLRLTDSSVKVERHGDFELGHFPHMAELVAEPNEIPGTDMKCVLVRIQNQAGIHDLRILFPKNLGLKKGDRTEIVIVTLAGNPFNAEDMYLAYRAP